MDLVCFATSHEALSHMKQRGSPTTAVLSEGKTLPEGSAHLEFPHQANGRAIVPSEHGENFQ